MGIAPEVATAPPAMRTPPARQDGNRGLLDQFVGAFTLGCGFRSIPLTGVSIAAGCSAWYGLGSWTPNQIGGEAAWCGYSAELNAPNSVPSADGEFTTTGNMAAWGTELGGGAAIVMGLDLPCNLGAWSSGPANVPWVEPSGTTFSINPDERVIVHFPPCTGSFASPIPRLVVSQMMTPLHIPVTQGRRLDVALVVRRSQVNGITKTSGIVGHCAVSLTLGSIRTRSFSSV